MSAAPKPADAAFAEAVREGLLTQPRSLPAWTLYDARGSELFEAITRLPAYDLTRAEERLLRAHAPALARTLAPGVGPLRLAELGAGSARKTCTLLRALVTVQGETEFLACDISPQALRMAADNVRERAPGARLRTLLGTHEQALRRIGSLPGRTLLCLLGSSLGNLSADEAVALLERAREAMGSAGSLLLGVDGPADARALRRAYDDDAGVTAAFTRNVLARCNRKLGADFDLRAFRHVVRWDEASSDLQIWLQSLRRQEVRLPGLGLQIALGRGERLHVETSAKYDVARIEGLLARAGLVRSQTHAHARYALHLARFAPAGA